MDRRSEKELVDASREGDRDAYGVLVSRHYERIFAICLGVMGDPHDAADTAQETVIRGLEGIGKLRTDDRVGAWLASIAKNVCLDLLRRQRRRRDAIAERAVTRPPTHDEDHGLEEAIRRLPIELRTPLLMYYFDGRSARSIAEALETSHTGICQRLRDARKELHKLLAEQGDS